MIIELIIPPNPYLNDETRNPPLGLLYIASTVEQMGHKVHVIDLRGKRVEEFQDLLGYAEIYGITAPSPDYPICVEIARIIKAKNPESWIVLGGVHASAVPGQIGYEFDKVVVGEGERAFLQVISDFLSGFHGTRFYQSPHLKSLDCIPFPARHLLPFETAFSKNALFGGAGYAGTLITSRGCAFNCAFCASDAIWGSHVRFRSPQNVVAEIEHIIRTYGVKAFRFQDDTMTLNQKRLEQLCQLLAPLGIRWRANARVDCSSLEVLRMMRRAGCEELAYGIESLSQIVLDKCNKKITIKDIHLALSNAKLAGMRCRLFFIVGLPGEPPGFTDRLEEFVDKFNPEMVIVSTFVPYPGSDIACHPERFGITIKNTPLDQFHMSIGLRGDEATRPLTFVHDVLSEEQIIKERNQAIVMLQNRKVIRKL